jgi:hypothetical protein
VWENSGENWIKNINTEQKKSESLYVLEFLLVKEDCGRIDKEKGDGKLGYCSDGWLVESIN